MKTGFNLLLWTTHVTEEHFPLIEDIKKTGYDGLEIPIFEGDGAHYKRLGKVLKDNGLAATAVTVTPDEERNPISADPKHRAEAVDYMKWVIDCAAAIDAELIAGPYHQPLGVFSGAPPTEEEKKRGADVHRQAAEYAAQAEVLLTIEYLNRFECYFLNTLADTVAYVQRVDHPNFATLHDTFHANIEEKNPIGCITAAKDFIRHVHVSENDRGTPGKGHVDFLATFKALRSIGYDGWLTIEAFGRALPDLAAATRVWRDFFPNREEVYREGYRFMKETWDKAG